MEFSMTSSFNIHDAGAYEQLMGRWSKKLAPLLIDFAGLAEDERIIDVGCGNGSLTFALARTADLRELVAIDYAPVFVEEAVQRAFSSITACLSTGYVARPAATARS